MAGVFIVKFVTAFAVVAPVSLAKEQAALLPVIFWISSASSRFMGTVLSSFIKPRYLILLQVSLQMTGALLTTFIGYNNEIALWVSIGTAELGQAISFAITASAEPTSTSKSPPASSCSSLLRVDRDWIPFRLCFGDPV
jgi:fucose permease